MLYSLALSLFVVVLAIMLDLLFLLSSFFLGIVGWETEQLVEVLPHAVMEVHKNRPHVEKNLSSCGSSCCCHSFPSSLVLCYRCSFSYYPCIVVIMPS